MKIKRMETPVLIVDFDKMLENLKRAMVFLEKESISLRPHYKSHKCIEIAKKQMEMGAKGITCAKYSEAEDLINAGINNVLIANQVVQPTKISRIAELAGQSYITICVDNYSNIHQFSKAAQEKGTTIHCLIELDVGMGRCGTMDFEYIKRLAQKIEDSPGLVFEGIQAYAGHLSHEADREFCRQEVENIENTLANLKKCLEKSGFVINEISGGSTGTIEFKCNSKVYTEIQAGSYLFMDAFYNKLKLGFHNTLFLVTTVISSRDEHIVTDAGVKSCSSDQGMPTIYGMPQGNVFLAEEHGIIQQVEHGLNIGDKVYFIPGHCCTTINLHDTLYLTRGDEVIDSYAITSRGKFF